MAGDDVGAEQCGTGGIAQRRRVDQCHQRVGDLLRVPRGEGRVKTGRVKLLANLQDALVLGRSEIHPVLQPFPRHLLTGGLRAGTRQRLQELRFVRGLSAVAIRCDEWRQRLGQCGRQPLRHRWHRRRIAIHRASQRQHELLCRGRADGPRQARALDQRQCTLERDQVQVAFAAGTIVQAAGGLDRACVGPWRADVEAVERHDQRVVVAIAGERDQDISGVGLGDLAEDRLREPHGLEPLAAFTRRRRGNFGRQPRQRHGRRGRVPHRHGLAPRQVRSLEHRLP